MNVKIQGFQLEVKNSDSTDKEIQKFGDFLVEKGEVVEESDGFERTVKVKTSENNKFFEGLVLTIKNQKKYSERVQDGNDYVFKVADVRSGHHIIEFNFFVICKNNGLGLYSYYHNSCSVGGLLKILTSNFRAFKSDCKQKKPPVLFGHYLVSEEDFKNLVSNLRQVKCFETTFTKFSYTNGEFEPIGDAVKTERRFFRLKPNISGQSLLSRIGSVFSIGKRTVVKGIGEDGLDKTFSTDKNLTQFGSYDYNDFLEKIDGFTINDFQSTWAINELKSKCKTEKEIFGQDLG